jgi:hypothetical protein
MTIMDEPDEDAADLDDDGLLEAYLDPGAPPAGDSATDMPEWPPAMVHDIGLTVDTATLAWFRNSHADWRREMGFILRAWVEIQTTASADLPA